MGLVKKLTLVYLVGLSLSACSTMSSVGRFGGETENFASGSAVADRLSGGDREALSRAMTTALDTGKTQQWRGARAVGVVMPGGYSLANLKPDPNERIAMARADIDTAHVMETELGLYVLTRNSNIRTGPGTDNSIAEVLPSGTGLDVVGHVSGKEWMLVMVDGRVRGYVHENLAIKAPGTELELAGGPKRRPVKCREFTQRVNIYSERDEWTGAACHDGAGWRLAGEPAPAAAEDDLLGL